MQGGSCTKARTSASLRAVRMTWYPTSTSSSAVALPSPVLGDRVKGSVLDVDRPMDRMNVRTSIPAGDERGGAHGKGLRGEAPEGQHEREEEEDERESP